jgi:hypothetical protein
MERLRRIICRPLVVLQGLLILMLLLAGIAWAAGPQLSAEAMNNFSAQAQTLMAAKAARTPVQNKINSQIVRYLHTKVLKDQAETLPKFQTGVELNSNNEILTDIKANVTDSLLAAIKANGGTIINQFPQYRAIRALIPITAVEVLAADPDVQFIDSAAKCETRKDTTSEGDVAHNCPTVRAKGFTGAGITVGVLSDSIQSDDAHPLDYVSAVQSTGDLPSTIYYLSGQAGTGEGEGVAMMEIVYDLAPSATLIFATANGGPSQFATNIQNLYTVGCNVIVDDVGYFNESPFQDDVISQAVNTVTAAGALYFSSAANSGNKHSGTSGTWEGDYVDGGGGPGQFGTYHLHAFATGQVLNQITQASSIYNLSWSDPLAGSGNDYDLYIIDSLGNIYAFSDVTQSGTQDPYEQINASTDFSGLYLVIMNYGTDGSGNAASRFLHLDANRGRIAYNTNGETHGHCTADAAFGVAATSAYHRTTPFTGSEAVEYFSSDGPRRIFYNPNGTAITPGNFLHTGGRVRLKPDIMAADGVQTSANPAAGAFNPFYGTSAAAPHAAAIAALLKSAGASNTQIRHALTSTALPSHTWNDYAGYGIIMADRAFNALSSKSVLSTLMLLLGN